MKENTTNQKSRLEYFKALLESARHAAAERDEVFERNMKQYLGSSEIDGGECASMVRNITYEIIESEISSDIPVPKVDVLSYSEEREKRAASIERLCATVRDMIPFDELNDLDERYTYVYGASIWYVEWNQDENDGGARVYCISPRDFLGQPGITDVNDMDYCFLTFTTTRDELVRRYAVSREESDRAEFEYKYGSEDGSDTAKVVVCFYRDEDGEIGRFVFSGELSLADTPKFYKRKGMVCKKCHAPEGECKCGAGYEVGDIESERLISQGGEIIVPYFTPKSFPIVIRKNTRSGDSLYGISDCDMIRHQQQAINKVESRIMQKLMRSGITPIMPEDSSVTLGNSIFGQVIKMRPGESASSYGKIDTTPDISQDVIEANRLYDQAKRIIGISDALQGLDSGKIESGYAKELKIAQSAGRLEAKRRMKNFAYSEIYRLIFEHYLAFADKARELSYKDGLGNVHTEQFDRTSFVELDGGAYIYRGDYYFSVDDGGGEAYKREALWQRNLENLQSGTLGDQSSPKTLLRYWQSQEKARYPFARDNVEYFKEIILNEKSNNKESENENERRNES